MAVTFILMCGMYVLLAVFSYIVVSPYTKVEESFNIQAIHDLIFHGDNISQFDHTSFPGVVPRSFIGPLLVSFFTLPFSVILELADGPKIYLQYAARGILGGVIVCGFMMYTSALYKVFGKVHACFCIVTTLTQFHFLFYASRPLPNIFALCVVLPALAKWIEKDFVKFIWLAAFAILVFRFELCILFGICLLISLQQGSIYIKTTLLHICFAGISVLGLTILLDTFFWGRWCWPEGEVMWFNIVLNKSSDWGVSPYHWYFTSVLPRCLLSSAVLIPWGLRSDPHRTIPLLLPALGFVCAFSILPHKELRFIIYTIPLFNAIAARGYADIFLRWRKSLLWKLCFLACVGGLVANFFASMMFSSAAAHNYAGGEIFRSLHEKVNCDSALPPVHVHICDFAAQSGVTRFGETCPHWKYDKTENLSPEILRDDHSFTHVIMEYGDVDNSTWSATHRVLDTQSIYAGLVLGRLPPPISFIAIPHIHTKPALVLLQRRDFRGSNYA